MLEAIILAGGMGTRLRTVVSDVPKPMAPVAGKPFLAWQLDYLIASGIERFIISTGYGAEIIKNYFGSAYREKEIVYAREESPLGTGGAIRFALDFASQKRVFVLNGDSLCDAKFSQLRSATSASPEALGIGVKYVSNAGRYGAIDFDSETYRIRRFGEKSNQEAGWINAGVYDIPRDALDEFALNSNFSFEVDFLQKMKNIALVAQPLGEFFIDIGIPEDYRRAQELIPAWLQEIGK